MLRLKDEKLKEKDELLCTRNLAQKAKLRNKVMLPPCFLPFSSIFFQDKIIKMRDREIAILRETMEQETESEEEAENND